MGGTFCQCPFLQHSFCILTRVSYVNHKVSHWKLEIFTDVSLEAHDIIKPYSRPSKIY